jgi:hypothetical protein
MLTDMSGQGLTALDSQECSLRTTGSSHFGFAIIDAVDGYQGRAAAGNTT